MFFIILFPLASYSSLYLSLFRASVVDPSDLFQNKQIIFLFDENLTNIIELLNTQRLD